MRPPRETKEEKFRRLAEARVNKILHLLRLLGNLSWTGTYAYKVKGIISESEYIEQSVKVTEEKIAFEKQVTELSEQLTQIQTTLAIHENKKLITSQYVGTRKLSKEMVSFLIDYILVGRTDPLTKETPVEIHLNF